MPDQITTKPFVSQAQAGWAFATGQPFARRWARQTGPYKRLPKRVRKKTCMDCVLASVKEQLSPGVTRIHGNLCNVHGRWARCPGSSAAPSSKRVAPKKLPAAPKPKAGKRAAARGKKGGAAAVKPKQTPEQRAAQHQADQAKQREANRQSVIGEMAAGDVGLQPAAAKALMSFADGTEDPAYTDGLVKAGLMERGADGTARLTSAGSAAVSAINHGNTRAALDAIGRGSDRAARDAERQTAADAKKKKGGGGGKGKKPPAPKAQPLPRNVAPRPVRMGGGAAPKPQQQPKPDKQPAPTLPQALLDAAQALSEGKPIDDTTEALLIRNGLAKRNRDGVLVLTAAGQRATKQAEKSFAVFKDASGAYRWIARTTTAYRDRDGEIISTQALEDDAARMTATKQYGPLRYWHVGQPDPLSIDQPWGPGLDIGDCDFSIVIGRTSIESGTFKSLEIGRAFAETAADFELSPGFFHAPMEPDAATGVFNHIRRFERSTVPTKHGRASNLFTGLTVKEHRMDQATYEQRVKAYLDFARAQGIPPEQAAAPLVAMEQADKDAAERRIAYKDEKPQGFASMLRAFLSGEQTTTKEETPPNLSAAGAAYQDAHRGDPDFDPARAMIPATTAEQVPPDPIAALKEELAALRTEIASLKAGPMMMGGADAETPMEDTAEGGMEEPVGDQGGLTLSSEDLAAIGQVIGATLEPLIGALGITQKLEGHLGELKTMMGGFVKQKDDADAQRTQELAALKTQVAELTGDAPRVGYRPTEASDNTAAALFAAIKDGPEGESAGPFADLTAQLFPQLAR